MKATSVWGIMYESRICDVLRNRARKTPEAVAHDNIRRKLTFREWDREADEIGGGLVSLGLKPGERVLLPISNTHAVEMAVCVLAIFRAGGIACPVNVRLANKEMAEYAALIEPRLCLTDSVDTFNGLNVSAVLDVRSLPRDPVALPDQSILGPDSPAEILGTSGTTGKMKGVVVTHGDLMRGVNSDRQDRSRSTLHALPLTGSGGNLGMVMLPLRGGACAITQPKFDAKEMLELAREKQPDVLYLVPSMLRLLLDEPAASDYDLEGIRYIMTGTAPLPLDSVVRAREMWPHVRIRNSYGMSEGGVSVGTSTQEQVLKPGCVGKLPSHMQIRDKDGVTIDKPGEIGEIFGWQEHPRKYWRDEKATADSFAGGWTKTGDLGYVDEDGDLIISGRSKELIIRGGYNITPLEIETVLHQHPSIQQAAVLGIPHAILGEDVAAAVTLRPDCIAESAEIIAYCREHLADNKVPRTLVVMASLPLNTNGKILKKDLIETLREAADLRRA